jgi:hypothetical protein
MYSLNFNLFKNINLFKNLIATSKLQLVCLFKNINRSIWFDFSFQIIFILTNLFNFILKHINLV